MSSQGKLLLMNALQDQPEKVVRLTGKRALKTRDHDEPGRIAICQRRNLCCLDYISCRNPILWCCQAQQIRVFDLGCHYHSGIGAMLI